jgi:hypothetical protein
MFPFSLSIVSNFSSGFPFPFTEHKVAAIEKLRATPSLEYAIFIIGFFLDFYGMLHAPTYLPGVSVVLDVENCKAAIPGVGNTPIVLTYTKDVARFMAASLNLPKWPQRSIIVGDKVTANELLEY